MLALGLWLRRSILGGTDQFLGFTLRIVPALGVGITAGWAVRYALLAGTPGGLEQLVYDLLTGGPLGFVAGELGALLQGGLVGIVALGVYLGLAAVLRVPGLTEVIGLVQRRILRRGRR